MSKARKKLTVRPNVSKIDLGEVVYPISMLLDKAKRIHGVNLHIVYSKDHNEEQIMAYEEAFSDTLALIKPSYEDVVKALESKRPGITMIVVLLD